MFQLAWPQSFSLVIGVVPGDGLLAVDVPLGELGAGIQGVPVYGQLDTFSLPPKLVLGGASVAVLLDASL